MLKLSVTIVILLAINIVTANTYYIDPSGNNSNPGTESQPWFSVQHAADMMIGGDMVYIKAGIYNEMVLLNTNSGTSGNDIVFSAFPGDEGDVFIDGTGIMVPPYEGLFYLAGVDHIQVIGIRVQNSKEAGFLAEYCSDISIINCQTYNTHSSGIGIWDCNTVIIDNNDIDHASMANQGGAADVQECLTISGTINFEVRNNKVHDCPVNEMGGEGIDVKDASENGKVYNNEVYNLMYDLGIYVDSWSSTCQNIEIYNNTVYNTTCGIALSAEDGGVLQDINVYNNLVYNNSENGIIISNWAEDGLRKNIHITNNTIYQNGEVGVWGGGIFIETDHVQNIDIRNNICCDNAAWQIALCDPNNGTVSIDYNLIDQFMGYNEPCEVEVRGTNYLEADPLFVNAYGNDFHLQSNSPCIDAGSSQNAPLFDFDYLIRPFDGDNNGTAQYDMGACEFGSHQSIYESQSILSGIGEIFPNPSNGIVYLPISISQSHELSVEVLDVYGNLIHSFEKGSLNSTKLEFDLSDYSSGIYFIRIWSGKDFLVRKVVIN